MDNAWGSGQSENIDRYDITVARGENRTCIIARGEAEGNNVYEAFTRILHWR